MRNYKSVAMLAIAALLAAAAGWGAVTYLNNKEQEIRARINAEANMKRVVVAKRALKPGEMLSSSVVAAREIPAGYIPDSAISPGEFSKYDGMVLVEPISPGKPLLRGYIKGMAGVSTFSQLIKPGERAVTLDAGQLETNESLIVSGDIIDIVVVLGKGANAQFATLKEKVMVLATGTKTIAEAPINTVGDAKPKTYQTLTVALKNRDVPTVIAAQEAGKLMYLVRNPDDKARARYDADVARAPKFDSIELIAGGSAKDGVLTSVSQAYISEAERLSMGKSQSDDGNVRRIQKYVKYGNDKENGGKKDVGKPEVGEESGKKTEASSADLKGVGKSAG